MFGTYVVEQLVEMFTPETTRAFAIDLVLAYNDGEESGMTEEKFIRFMDAYS